MRSRLVPLALLVAAPLQAQETARPGFFDIFNADRLVTAFVQSGISSLRTLTDLTYEQISVDAVGSRISVVGIVARPNLRNLGIPDCTITADRLVVSGRPLDELDRMALSGSLDGVVVDYDCFPREARAAIGLSGIEDIRIPRLQVDLNYSFPSGAADAAFSVDISDLIAISGDVEMAYISYAMDFAIEQPLFGVDIRSAEIVVEDLGLWDQLSTILPAEMRAPDVLAATVGDGLISMLEEMNGPFDPTLTPRQLGFAREAAALAAVFEDGPRRIVMTMAPAAPVRIDERRMLRFQDLFDSLSPALSATPRKVSSAIPVAQLSAALEGTLDGADRLTVARALASGDGAPRNTGLALSLLGPVVAETEDPEAAGLMATLLADVEPEAAYDYALLAAAGRAPGALGLLDRIEPQLDYDSVRRMQTERSGPRPSLTGASAMRSRAVDRLVGNGASRDYAAAAYWATLAGAAGDPTATVLLDELETTMRLRGHLTSWRIDMATIEAEALRTWIEGDLPARLVE